MGIEINSLQEHKRQLLARSELYRQTLTVEFQELKEATAWIGRTLRVARALSPVLLAVAPLVGFFFSGRRLLAPRPAKPIKSSTGLFSKAVAGWNLYRKIKPVWDGFRNSGRPSR